MQGSVRCVRDLVAVDVHGTGSWDLGILTGVRTLGLEDPIYEGILLIGMIEDPSMIPGHVVD